MLNNLITFEFVGLWLFEVITCSSSRLFVNYIMTEFFFLSDTTFQNCFNQSQSWTKQVFLQFFKAPIYRDLWGLKHIQKKILANPGKDALTLCLFYVKTL